MWSGSVTQSSLKRKEVPLDSSGAHTEGSGEHCWRQSTVLRLTVAAGMQVGCYSKGQKLEPRPPGGGALLPAQLHMS